MPVRDEILEPVRRVLAWMLQLADEEGRIVCPWHKVEHTGKNAGVIVLASELLRHDPERDEAFLMKAAVTQARRLVANLKREGTSECHTFRPGRYDPFNCSNHVIDGGACSDALAHLVTELGDRLDPADREAFTNASVLHARTYLRYAALDKGIPAQRAWAVTGLAGATRLVDDPELEQAALEAVGALEAIQHEDGSYPYHPVEWGAGHVGASDVSAFYQSRVTGFLLYALERMGRSPDDALFRAPLFRGLDFLLALQGPDGIKCGLVEAKPWYWGATYEVASHPFDVFALSAGWRTWRRTNLAQGARAAFEAWARHLKPDGEPQSHLPGPGRTRSYQCPVFWAGHAMWLARSLPMLEELWEAGAPEAPGDEGDSGRGIDLGLSWFPSAHPGRRRRRDDPRRRTRRGLGPRCAPRRERAPRQSARRRARACLRSTARSRPARALPARGLAGSGVDGPGGPALVRSRLALRALRAALLAVAGARRGAGRQARRRSSDASAHLPPWGFGLRRAARR